MLPFFTTKSLESDETGPEIPIYVTRPSDCEETLAKLSPDQLAYAQAKDFSGAASQMVRIHRSDGSISAVLLGAGETDQDDQGPIRTGQISTSIRKGRFKLADIPSDWDAGLAAVGWGLGAYRFDRYLNDDGETACLNISDLDNASEIQSLVEACALGRDLINTPSNDMGPVALEDAARGLASRYEAKVKVTVGEALLEENLPMIHAVGRAAHEPPRLVEFFWGNPDHPRLAIAGKGITFDTGGVNIKSAGSARLMKKDMGGAAHALAIAHMIMANDLPINLHVLLSIAENAVSAGAYRPGDILTARNGKTVEIDNTDAEGRLVLGDALTLASEKNPKLIIDFATLTGAARVALGPTLPPFFCNRTDVTASVVQHCEQRFDPIWPMPLWDPYFNYLKSPIADMKNSGGSFAGCITAALFLKQFVGEGPWMHLDVYGWNPSRRPGHPSGGEVFAIRGLYDWLKTGAFAKLD